jgi:4-amino-4-deoxy-L-arabinose transferase-like glycosyltransferase
VDEERRVTAAPIRGNAPAGRTRRLALDQRDWVLSLLLFAAVVVYLASLPRTLGIADESYFLYEARRIREGQVMYRDFFQFVTPGAWYLMAALYGLFGTNIVTARISMAVLHGLTAVLFYSSGRLVGVRRSLSLLPPLAYVALCQPAWPYASPHWFSTFMTALLLLATLRLPWPERPRSSR